MPSERVTGLGLRSTACGDLAASEAVGEWYGGLDHTSFILIFQRTAK